MQSIDGGGTLNYRFPVVLNDEHHCIERVFKEACATSSFHPVPERLNALKGER
jgi:hypothetical protein